MKKLVSMPLKWIHRTRFKGLIISEIVLPPSLPPSLSLLFLFLAAELIYTNTPPANMWMAVQNVERVLLKLDREGRAAAYKPRAGELVRVELPQKGFIMALDEGIVWFLHKQAADLITGRADQFLVQLRQLERNTPEELFDSMTEGEQSEAKKIINSLETRLWHSLTRKVAKL